jgi:hypothetical protein
METCPYCGHLAHTADGAFQIAGTVLTVIQAPGVTRAMLAALSTAVKKAYENKTPPDILAKEVEKIDPTFGEVIRKSNITPGFYLVVLLIILQMIRSCSLNMTLDINRLLDQLMHTPPAAVVAAPDLPVTEPPAPMPP